MHLLAGIWGTLAVVFSDPEANLGAQLFGILSIGCFVIVASALVWLALRFTLGIRVSEEAEIRELDMAELGMEAYPEFTNR